MIKERKIESIRFETKAVIYQNETGFKILAGVAYNADSGEMLRKCSLKGQLSDVEDGDTLFVSGDWDEHPKYGVGFRAEAYVKAVPQDKKSMLAYLKHGNIAGISAKRAELIIDKFGDNAFDVLVYQPHLLEGIRGIGKKTIEKIKVSAKDKLETQNMIAQIMRYIQGFDISPAYSNKIYKQYGLDSIKVLKENPYRLADDITGVGFLKADEIALKNGIPETSPFRVESAVLYILKQMNKDGDVFSYIQDIEAEGKEFLKLDKSYIDKAVESLVNKKRVIREDDAVYLTNLFKAEEHAAKRIVELLSNNTKCIEVTDADVKRLKEEAHMQYEYADKQCEAIIAACKSDVLILTGGPGTGKTTTVNGIIKMLEKHGLSVLCAAPTGRAAKRMTYVAKQSKADLVIGNFKCIYENDKKEKKNNAIFTSGAMYNHVFRDEDVIDCVHFQCIEGNKLWNTEMISHCGVRFQNTCISSDFIFYHQCLGYCKVVATISDKILLRHIYSNSNSKKYSDVITSKTPFEMILDGYKKAGRENFAAEIQKDELIYILDELKKIPEYDTKEIRKKVFESLTEIDFDSSLFSTEEEKKMIKQYKKIKAGKWWYVSDIRAAIRR